MAVRFGLTPAVGRQGRRKCRKRQGEATKWERDLLFSFRRVIFEVP